MKKLLAILAICLLPGMAWGAIAATTVWEIQSGAGASNNNGCAFNPANATPGTDYSTTAAPNDSGTDLASADGDVAGCVVTSATHNFVDADEGNFIHITEAGDGFTLGWYEIVSTAGNAATLDRACGTDGAKTGGDWAYGGACKIADTLDDDMFSAVTAGNTIYIKSGTYAAGESISPTTGSDALQIKFYGYKTTRANALDGTTTGADRPVITIFTAAVAGFDVATGFWDVRNLEFTGDVWSSNGLVNLQASSYVYNCKFTNVTATADKAAYIGGATNVIVASEFKSENGYAVFYGANSILMNSYIHNSKYCANPSGLGTITLNNIIDTCTTCGMEVTSTRDNTTIIGNTFYGANSGIAINISTIDRLYIFNNIIADWTTGIVHTGTQLVEDYNLYFSNTHDINATDCLAGTTCGLHSFVSAGDPFLGTVTAAAAGDFRVNAYAKALAFPNGVILPGTDAASKGYTDIGALQRQEPTMASAW